MDVFAIVAAVITGVVITVITGTLIPFVTTQFSLWSDHRRSVSDARRHALNDVIAAQAAVHTSFGKQVMKIRAAGQGGSAGPTELDNAKIRAARSRLAGHFTTGDRVLVDMLRLTSPKNSHATPYLSTEATMILSTWANGDDGQARRAARNLIAEVQRRNLRRPDSDDPGQTDDPAEGDVQKDA